MAYVDLLKSELQIFSIQLSQSQIAALARYCAEVDRWNQKINLTGLSGAGLVRRLVVEPVWIARQLDLAGTLVDVGSGNGSPAIPFRIVFPRIACHLVEARSKRAAFLRHMIGTLGLADVVVHRARVEESTGKLPRPDWISLQAVALTPSLVGKLRQFADPTTTIVWITSRDIDPTLSPTRTFEVPLTGSRVFLFRLDLS